MYKLIKTVKVDIYRQKIEIYTVESVKDLESLEKDLELDLGGRCGGGRCQSKRGNFSGKCIDGGKTQYIILNLSSFAKRSKSEGHSFYAVGLGTLTHELLHAKDNIFRRLNVDLEDKEANSYLMGYLMEEVADEFLAIPELDITPEINPDEIINTEK